MGNCAMRLLVTGGAGFIGSNFIHMALGGHLPAIDELERLVVLDALTYAGNPENLTGLDGDPRFRFVHGDLNAPGLIAALLHDEGITHVAHFAAESHVDRSIDAPRAFFDTNVMGTLTLLEAVRDSGGVRLLHVSTDEVFGSLGTDDPAFCETTPYDPRSPYSASKAASDHLVRAFLHTYGIDVVITNCSNNYGPRQFPEKLIPLMILNALEDKPLPIYGDGGNVRDWLEVGDHCTALSLVLARGRSGETYAIGGEAEKTNLQVVDTLCAVLDSLHPRVGGSHTELKTFVRDRPGHDRRYAMDIRKIRAELGWSPSVDFHQGLTNTVRWYLDNRPWCDAITSGRYARQRLGTSASSAGAC